MTGPDTKIFVTIFSTCPAAHYFFLNLRNNNLANNFYMIIVLAILQKPCQRLV